jgi:predicted transcriptional regulator
MSVVHTSVGEPLTGELLRNYFRNLVNQFFKILPMRENGEDSLCVYMTSLQAELIGCKSLYQISRRTLYSHFLLL